MAVLGGLMGTVKEKWNASGGNEFASNISKSLPQGTQDYITQAQSKLFNREHFRSPTVFFGFGEERPFYFERTPALLVPRMKHNLTFFYLNYMVLTAILFVLTLIVSPGAIIGIAILGFAWVAVIRATQEGSVKIKGITITQKQASIGMSALSVLALFYILSNIFWWTLATSGFICGAHAVMRDAAMHKDEEDKVQMSGDLALSTEDEDAAFLNPVKSQPAEIPV
eukprot:CAMPEP_0185728824 /NCGR_PEP_ID=MMETSP1171-20130828/4221_1 /TAXON_ID=374046 /ORGANISM="Helicotheca tamensis, Strain CCMP826" /LENGTH=224 /DNA_ID=CAMNT_0028397571 /DNA_START=135 /DNA_END=809 /DNA_ORIENTATION=+